MNPDEINTTEGTETQFVGALPDMSQAPQEDDAQVTTYVNPELPQESASTTEAETNEEVVEETAGEASEESVEEPAPTLAIEDPDDPVNNVSSEKIKQLLQQVDQMVRIMESTWEADKRDYGITDSQMKAVYQYNEQHRTQMPEGLSEEEKNKWDHFNGLDEITDEELIEIFGEDHLIMGVSRDQALDRVKSCVQDFFGWLSALREYRDIHDSYLKLLEAEELKNIKMLEAIAAKEENPEKKAKMEAAIKTYYNRKYLDFLAEPLEDDAKTRIIKALSDENKVTYWLNRTRDKLRQMKISDKFILEISQFEKRFLEEKYHECSNCLLLYFMNTIIYCDAHDHRNPNRNKAVCMVFALDGCIRNTWDEETKERVMNNIRAFAEQFIGLVPKKVISFPGVPEVPDTTDVTDPDEV